MASIYKRAGARGRGAHRGVVGGGQPVGAGRIRCTARTRNIVRDTASYRRFWVGSPDSALQNPLPDVLPVTGGRAARGGRRGYVPWVRGKHEENVWETHGPSERRWRLGYREAAVQAPRRKALRAIGGSSELVGRKPSWGSIVFDFFLAQTTRTEWRETYRPPRHTFFELKTYLSLLTVLSNILYRFFGQAAW